MIIFEKDYSDESLIDLAEDIQDAVFDDNLDIPKDDHGFRKGTFVVKVVWEDR
jgi:hypothetical protein